MLLLLTLNSYEMLFRDSNIKIKAKYKKNKAKI